MHLRILTGLALAATTLVAVPASANGVTPATMHLTNTSGQMASAENAHRQPAPGDAGLRDQTRRENTYRASYHRKHGTNPTEQQVRAWYAHTYRHQPS
jgi:hypothetical protein